MSKFNFIFLSSLLLVVSSKQLNSMNILAQLLDPNKIKAEAAANIAKQEAEKKAAEIAAEADRITKERAELIAAGLKVIGYLVCNTLRFSYKLVSNPPRTFALLKNGKEEAWAGLFGLSASIIGGTIIYKIHDNERKLNDTLKKISDERKKQEQEKTQNNNVEPKQTSTEPSAPSEVYEDYDQPGLAPCFPRFEKRS